MTESKAETLELTPEGVEAAILSLMATRSDADSDRERMGRYEAEGYVEQILRAVRTRQLSPL